VCRVDRLIVLALDRVVEQKGGQVDHVLAVDLVDLKLAQEKVGRARAWPLMAESATEVDHVRHPDHVDEDVDLLAVAPVEKVQAAIALHEVEAVVRLVAERWKKCKRPLAVLRRDHVVEVAVLPPERRVVRAGRVDRKSTRLNSSHQIISYAVFCLKKK